jgi:plasmid maintenance system antidote protein VapI
MFDQDPTVRSREVGWFIAGAAEAAGMNQLAMARALDWSPSMVSRMISGKRPVSAENVSGVLGLLRVTGLKRKYAMSLARRATEHGLTRELGDISANPDTDDEIPGHDIMRRLEDMASDVVVFSPNWVPALLQTEEYISALMSPDSSVRSDDITSRVKRRLDRSDDVLNRRPILLFLIGEHALCRTGPSLEVMSAQVHHLLRISVRPNVTIQVIPDISGFRARAKNPYQFMNLTDETTVVCVENETSLLFLERDESIKEYAALTTNLSHLALDQTETRTWLTALAERLSAQLDGGDTDGAPDNEKNKDTGIDNDSQQE